MDKIRGGHRLGGVINAITEDGVDLHRRRGTVFVGATDGPCTGRDRQISIANAA